MSLVPASTLNVWRTDQGMRESRSTTGVGGGEDRP
jgi:hypothetical protein